MSFGQTNGIPQGSVLMDFIAEIVLGFGDYLLTLELDRLGITDYKIIRYRDDYRIFTNNPQLSSEIAKVLSEVLSKLNFKLNSAKTNSTDDVVLGSKYFLDWLQNKENSEDRLGYENPEVLISLLVNLAYNNPRLFVLVSASLSFLIPKMDDIQAQKELLVKIKNKFSQLPNTNYLNIWLQRITLKVDATMSYPDKLCEKVIDPNFVVWNSDWLNTKIRKLIEKTDIVKRDVVESIEIPFTKEETEQFGEYDKLFS